MKDFLKSQLEEIRENKLRFGLLIICLVVAIIYAFADSFDSGEEINLDAPQKVAQVESPAKNISSTSEKVTVSSDKVKAVISLEPGAFPFPEDEVPLTEETTSIFRQSGKLFQWKILCG